MDKKEIYTGIDVMKLIASMLVVLLHTVETSEFYAAGVKFVFTRFAVPFFFVASGFFLCKGLEKASNKREFFIRYEKKLITLFIVWGVVISGPFTITSYIQNNSSEGILKIIFLLFRRIFVIGSGSYWYLVALIWSAAFIYYCNIKKKDAVLVIGIVLGLCLTIMYSCFRGILSEITIFESLFDLIYYVYSWEFNFIMYGIPFMGIGYFIYKKNIHVCSTKAFWIFVAATFVRVVEYMLRYWFTSQRYWMTNDISFAYIIQAIFIFLFVKEWKPNIAESTSLKFRQLSSFIYFAHAIILYDILNPLLIRFTSIPVYESRVIPMKLCIVCLICIVLFTIIKKLNSKKLNILING